MRRKGAIDRETVDDVHNWSSKINAIDGESRSLWPAIR